MSLEQLGLEFVKLGVPSVKSVWVGVDSERLNGGETALVGPWPRPRREAVDAVPAERASSDG